MSTFDLAQLRELIEAEFAQEPRDRLQEVARDHLRTAFNDVAPEAARLSPEGVLALQVTPAQKAPLASHQVARLSEHMARAVASIGHELANPSAGPRLSPTDYRVAPIYTSYSPAGMLVFTAARGAVLVNGEPVESQSERAMTRLANLLPESADDSEVAHRVLSLREPSARAVREVALAAKSVHGLTLHLRGSAEPVDSVVTADQAANIDDLLSDMSEVTEPITLDGFLDGVRFSRRLFYLVREHEPEVPFTVDEEQLETTQALLGNAVVARLSRITRKRRDGSAQRPTYRLISISPAQELL